MTTKRNTREVIWSEQRLGSLVKLYEARPRKKPPTKPLDRTMFLLIKSVACEKSEKIISLISKMVCVRQFFASG